MNAPIDINDFGNLRWPLSPQIEDAGGDLFCINLFRYREGSLGIEKHGVDFPDLVSETFVCKPY